MNRRFAVLGLVLAMCGTVSGQTEQTTAPVVLPTQPGPTSLRVESVGPLLTRISLMRNGAEELALTGASYTVTMDAKGTTITTYNVEVNHLGGTLMILRDGRPFVLHVRTDGTWAFRIPSQSQQ